VDSRGGLDAVAKRKFYHYPCREVNPGIPSRSIVKYRSDIVGV